MKTLKRSPLKFDSFTLLAELARELGIPLKKAATSKILGRRIITEVNRLTKNKAYIYGQRAEATFEMIVAELGSVRILKHEDTGRLHYSIESDLQLPDFRIILDDKRTILVEVKNETASRLHRHRHGYFESLVRYAEEMGCEFYFAIQWVSWRLWSLVHHRHFTRGAEHYELSFLDAIKNNQMRLVGDKYFGTTAPLRFRTEFEHLETVKVTSQRSIQTLRPKRVQLFSQDRPIIDPDERRIALAFMFYGEWIKTRAEETNERGEIVAVNIDLYPRSPEGEAPARFALIGTASGLISGMYQASTSKPSKRKGGQPLLTGVLPTFQPGRMRHFVPKDFFEKKDRALHLTVLHLEMSASE